MTTDPNNNKLLTTELRFFHIHNCYVSIKHIVKASSYIAQYPVFRTVQSALYSTSLTDLFTQTPSRLLWETSSHMLQLGSEGYSYTIALSRDPTTRHLDG